MPDYDQDLLMCPAILGIAIRNPVTGGGERGRLKREPSYSHEGQSGWAAGMAKLNWSDEKVDNPSWTKALAEVPLMVAREDTATNTPPAITVAIDQYAEKAVEQSRVLPELTLDHWWWQEGSRPLIVRDSWEISKNAPLP
jgi:hypothetical protein